MAEYDDLKDAIKAIGPKRVRTRDMEIESHDPEKISRLVGRTRPLPRMSNITIDIAVPKDGCICETIQRGGCSG